MPKTRRTRKQKILIDQKKQVETNTTPSGIMSQKKGEKQAGQQPTAQGMTFSLPTTHTQTQPSSKKIKQTTAVTISTEEYSYLGVDLIRTAVLTGAIVLTEIVIKLVFKG